MRLYGLVLSVIPMCLMLSCSRSTGYVGFSGYAQGGTYTVKYNSAGVKIAPEEVRDSVETLLKDIDFSVSGYNRNSLLSRRNAGEEVEEDRYLTELTELSEYYRNLTEGAFNAAAAPLFDIWGFGFTGDSMPSPQAVSEALERCASGEVLNFNAIAQGYTCDVVAGYLHSIGVHDMLVDIGEIYCEGLNPSGSGWTIGIDNPVDGNESPGADMRAIWSSEGRACGIVTSGNYRKFYVKDGRKYAHTIDPRTGYPVGHDLLSATVVASDATSADALATYCMVIGPEQARSFILSHPDIEGCLITSDSLWTSPGFTLKR